MEEREERGRETETSHEWSRHLTWALCLVLGTSNAERCNDWSCHIVQALLLQTLSYWILTTASFGIPHLLGAYSVRYCTKCFPCVDSYINQMKQGLLAYQTLEILSNLIGSTQLITFRAWIGKHICCSPE